MNTPEWSTDWQKDQNIWDAEKESPYESWRKTVYPDYAGYAARASTGSERAEAKESNSGDAPPTGVDQLMAAIGKIARDSLLSAGGIVPDSKNAVPGDNLAWQPCPLRAQAPPRGTPIVGVIDDGIALSHSQFMSSIPGKTRILSAWQQSALFGCPSGVADLPADSQARLPGSDAVQRYLPFGNELHQSDIDELRADCTVGGHLDEDMFNRRSGLVDMLRKDGQRTLAARDAHGTHVADVAAGDTDAGLIFVNLPSRKLVGLSGALIEWFLLVGIVHIILRADQLWKNAKHEAEADGTQGYPIVINMSFSKAAGGRDALTVFGILLDIINRYRKSKCLSKVHFVFPAGNDNLLEGVGNLTLEPKGDAHHSATFEIEVSPEDQTPSFIEIWTQIPDENLVDAPLDIFLEGPGGAFDSGSLSQGSSGEFRTLTQNGNVIARLFNINFEDGQVVLSTLLTNFGWDSSTFGANDTAPRILRNKPTRQRIILALRPTLDQSNSAQQLPAGRWKITVRNQSPFSQIVSVSVQSDQASLPSSKTGRRPRLVDAKYQRFAENGDRIDSYSHPENELADTPYSALHELTVRRHGTINAISSASISARREDENPLPPLPESTKSICVVAGYRNSDNRPAIYSSTGFNDEDPRPTNAENFNPTAAFPTDESPTLFGILASGSRDGSRVAYRGTSFAAAQATRAIVDHLKTIKVNNNSHATDAILHLEGDGLEVPSVPAPKLGNRRIVGPARGRPSRVG